jgi:hypothetical protein
MSSPLLNQENLAEDIIDSKMQKKAGISPRKKDFISSNDLPDSLFSGH